VKSLIVALTVLLGSLVCSLSVADTASDLFALQKTTLKEPNSAVGVWEMGPFDNGNAIFTVRTRIEQNETTAALKCEKGGQVAMVSVTVPSVLTTDSLTYTKPDSNAVTQNGVNCDINIHVGTHAYTIDNGVMSVEDSSLPAAKIAD
jgi:hypothetical protein